MSAYVVSSLHINTLATWAKMNRVSYYWEGSRRETQDNTARIASVLYAENVRSVNSRYNESTPADGFRFCLTVLNCTPVAILKAVNCYEYQACEASDWEKSEAFAICRAIKECAIRKLPGYETAAWELARA